MQLNTTVVSIAAVHFKKAAVIIAIHGQKTLHWQLSKVILSGIQAIHLYNHLQSDTLYKI